MTSSDVPSNKKAALAVTLDAVISRLDLAVAEEWRENVLVHLSVLDEAAALLHEFPLDDRIEPAPVFVP